MDTSNIGISSEHYRAMQEERKIAALERIAIAQEAQVQPQPMRAITFQEYQDKHVQAFQALSKALQDDLEDSKHIRIGVIEDRLQEYEKAFSQAMRIVMDYRRAVQALLGKEEVV
jgi:hypothetical protein